MHKFTTRFLSLSLCAIVMNTNKSHEYRAYDERCTRLLGENLVRFAGVIDEEGRLLAGGFDPAISPLERDEERLRSFMKFISKITISNKHDDSLGPVNYIAIRRDRAVLVSFPFPVSHVLLLVSVEPTADIEKISSHIVSTFSGVI